jgi:hypothetical protein
VAVMFSMVDCFISSRESRSILFWISSILNLCSVLLLRWKTLTQIGNLVEKNRGEFFPGCRAKTRAEAYYHLICGSDTAVNFIIVETRFQ